MQDPPEAKRYFRIVNVNAKGCNRTMTSRKKYPTEEVEPDHFLTNETIHHLINTQASYIFTQNDYFSLYNCVHCNECGTSEERLILKQKFLHDGNNIEGLDQMIRTFEKFGTPFKLNKSRIKKIDGIMEDSKTLLYLGCFTTVKTPKYGESIIKYLIQKNIEFCTLTQEICCGYPILCTGAIDTYKLLVARNRKLFKKNAFKKIITVCPSCYMVFKKEYSDLGIEIEYFTKYLEPSKTAKTGQVSIQHACPLKNGEIPGIDRFVEKVLRDSGYEILNIPHWCCGGGVGTQLRIDVAEKIANIRVKDYKGDYITFYCPDCSHFIKIYGRKNHIAPEIKSICELLI
jgi:Fe-S oxidoreductase